MARMLPASDALFDYITRVGMREHPALKRCHDETMSDPMAEMQIGADQGAVMGLIVPTSQSTRTTTSAR